ncbi:hypothetical protein LIER_12469 [Lithospermum erythrorhizon]|uniref:CCHC-type domain-containing protein n=1 Tax=Lithospermum erythrorhizon TaxID=34254 RepID=A0AAV3PTP9_LITER
MILDIRSRLSLMVFHTFPELKNVSLKDVPEQRSRFSQGQFSAPATNSQFSYAGSVRRPLNRFGGSHGTYRERHESGRCFDCGNTDHRVQNCTKKELGVDFKVFVDDDLEVEEIRDVELAMDRMMLVLDEARYLQLLSR